MKKFINIQIKFLMQNLASKTNTRTILTNQLQNKNSTIGVTSKILQHPSVQFKKKNQNQIPNKIHV